MTYNKKLRRLETAKQTKKCGYCKPHSGENRYKRRSKASVRDRRLWNEERRYEDTEQP